PLPDVLTDADMQFFWGKSSFESDINIRQDNDFYSGHCNHEDTTDAFLLSMLTTETLSAACPGLYEVYGSAPLSVASTSTLYPTLDILSSAAYMNITGTIEVYVGESVADGELAITLGASVGLAMQAHMRREQTSWGEVSTFGWDYSGFNATVWNMESAEGVGEMDTDGVTAHQLMAMYNHEVAGWFNDLPPDTNINFQTLPFYDVENCQYHYDKDFIGYLLGIKMES
ncbi:hypothetical protein KIPB_003635, partial [Kipferlia bialata]